MIGIKNQFLVFFLSVPLRQVLLYNVDRLLLSFRCFNGMKCFIGAFLVVHVLYSEKEQRRLATSKSVLK